MTTRTPQERRRRGPVPTFKPGKAIARLIEISGMSDEAFSDLSGASLRTVRAWRKHEKKHPPADRLAELARRVSIATRKTITLDSLFVSEDKKIYPDCSPKVL